jgi:hypothetical protein
LDKAIFGQENYANFLQVMVNSKGFRNTVRINQMPKDSPYILEAFDVF